MVFESQGDRKDGGRETKSVREREMLSRISGISEAIGAKKKARRMGLT